MKLRINFKKTTSFFAALSLLFCFCTLSAQTEIKRIVSLAPSLTKSLYYLDAKDILKGHTSYCLIAKDDGKEIVASAVKVNIEKVITLKPDLVIATTITNSETIEILKKAGIHTQVFPSPKSFDEICSQFELLGKLIGKEELAKKIVKESRNKVVKISSEYKYSSSPAMFFQIGAKPIFTVLPNTFMNDFITLSQGSNIAQTMTKGTITREYVMMKNPDIIFIVTMGIVGSEEEKIWKSYSALNAVKNKKIFSIDSDLACSPTPVDFAKTMEIIAGLLK